MNYKYGTKIKVLNGLFEGCNGIFFTNNKDNEALVEVFFKTPIEWKEGEDYFADIIKHETTSTMIRISKDYIEEIIL